MGGRSSTFKYDNLGNEISTLAKYTPLIPAEKDTISERNNDNIDILQEDNITVCRSTDNFSHENINPNFIKIREINDKFYGIVKNLKHTNLDIRGAKFEDSTIACFSHNLTDKDDMTIFLSSDLSTKTKHQIEKDTKDQIDMKYWSPCDNNELINHTLAHEYGHFVQKLLIEKNIDKEKRKKQNFSQNKLDYSMEAIKIKNSILKIQKEKFNETNSFISEYATENSREFFAEVFANLMTSKEPTNLAKSLEIYIKENL